MSSSNNLAANAPGSIMMDTTQAQAVKKEAIGFLSLPRELRDMIYGYCFTAPDEILVFVDPYLKWVATSTELVQIPREEWRPKQLLDIPRRTLEHCTYCRVQHGVDLSLLEVCKQFNLEGLREFYCHLSRVTVLMDRTDGASLCSPLTNNNRPEGEIGKLEAYVLEQNAALFQIFSPSACNNLRDLRILHTFEDNDNDNEPGPSEVVCFLVAHASAIVKHFPRLKSLLMDTHHRGWIKWRNLFWFPSGWHSRYPPPAPLEVVEFETREEYVLRISQWMRELVTIDGVSLRGMLADDALRRVLTVRVRGVFDEEMAAFKEAMIRGINLRE